MKHRFESPETQKGRLASRNLIVSVISFLLIALLFWIGISLVSNRTDSREAEIVKDAITRGIIHCYTSEGFYPESLEYLKQNYGLRYDEERFFIDYQALGSNLLPDVTVIDRGGM
ncbi:MAG: hypothetical protein HFE76_06700 [Firmicutes bacterium]|nr:hypothetical protein [Bacillota bacterium]